MPRIAVYARHGAVGELLGSVMIPLRPRERIRGRDVRFPVAARALDRDDSAMVALIGARVENAAGRTFDALLTEAPIDTLRRIPSWQPALEDAPWDHRVTQPGRRTKHRQ